MNDSAIDNLKELRIIGGFICFKKGTAWINISHIEEFYPDYARHCTGCSLKYKMIDGEVTIESPLIFSDKEDADCYIESLLIRLKSNKR